MNISDILIQIENTNQRPTSKNKASYEKVVFKNRWIKQRYIVLDKNQIQHNNNVVDEILSKLTFENTAKGNRENKITGEYSSIENKLLSSLVKHIQTVFDMEPFQKTAINDLIYGQEIFVILMNKSNSDGIRSRTVYPNTCKIKALMQGADSKDKTKIIYEGDNFVIIDKNKINIQIHKIVPKIDGVNNYDVIQYMFAIYIPKEKTYYVKK